MFSLSAQNAYDVVRPLHICSQMIGITSFELSERNNVFVDSVRWRDILCIAVSTVWSASVAFMFIFNVDKMWEIKLYSLSAVFERSMFCVVLAFLAITVLSNWWTFAARHHFSRIFNLLVEIDEELSRIHEPINFRKHKKSIIIFIGITMTLACFSIALTRFVGLRNVEVSTAA